MRPPLDNNYFPFLNAVCVCERKSVQEDGPPTLGVSVAPGGRHAQSGLLPPAVAIVLVLKHLLHVSSKHLHAPLGGDAALDGVGQVAEGDTCQSREKHTQTYKSAKTKT